MSEYKKRYEQQKKQSALETEQFIRIRKRLMEEGKITEQDRLIEIHLPKSPEDEIIGGSYIIKKKALSRDLLAQICAMQAGGFFDFEFIDQMLLQYIVEPEVDLEKISKMTFNEQMLLVTCISDAVSLTADRMSELKKKVRWQPV